MNNILKSERTSQKLHFFKKIKIKKWIEGPETIQYFFILGIRSNFLR